MSAAGEAKARRARRRASERPTGHPALARRRKGANDAAGESSQQLREAIIANRRDMNRVASTRQILNVSARWRDTTFDGT